MINKLIKVATSRCCEMNSLRDLIKNEDIILNSINIDKF